MIVRISWERALPFIEAYNRMFDTAVANPDEAKFCLWCGVEVRGVIKAVLGLRPMDDQEVFVWGMFGDGSGDLDEIIAGVYLTKIVETMPFDLSGAILPTNTDQQRRAAMRGWTKTDTQVMCGSNGELQDLWIRPYKGGK